MVESVIFPIKVWKVLRFPFIFIKKIHCFLLHLQIQWFWRALRSFDQADRAKFLQFVTGTSKVPLLGFSKLEGMNGVQKFQIHRDDRSTDRLPCAHTWSVITTFFLYIIRSRCFSL